MRVAIPASGIVRGGRSVGLTATAASVAFGRVPCSLPEQFGYVVYFSVSWPPAAFVCALHTMFRLRSNVLRLTKCSMRPQPQTASGGIGLWLQLLLFEAVRPPPPPPPPAAPTSVGGAATLQPLGAAQRVVALPLSRCAVVLCVD